MWWGWRLLKALKRTHQLLKHGGQDGIIVLRKANRLAVDRHLIVLHSGEVVIARLQHNGCVANPSRNHDTAVTEHSVAMKLDMSSKLQLAFEARNLPRIKGTVVKSDHGLLVGADDGAQYLSSLELLAGGLRLLEVGHQVAQLVGFEQ